MSNPNINWAAIDTNPKFQALHRKKTFFLWGLMVFSTIYYFLLPIGAAYFQDLFKDQSVGRDQRRHPVRAVRVRGGMGNRFRIFEEGQCRVRCDGAGDH